MNTKYVLVAVILVCVAGFVAYKYMPSSDSVPNTPSLSDNSNQVRKDMANYKVEKVLNISCKADNECATPTEYLIRSNCPYTSICEQNKCAVICPEFK